MAHLPKGLDLFVEHLLQLVGVGKLLARRLVLHGLAQFLQLLGRLLRRRARLRRFLLQRVRRLIHGLLRLLRLGLRPFEGARVQLLEIRQRLLQLLLLFAEPP